ncbi:DUF4446 family protein [Alicyclobacillus sp.]|uniref:DUF4446 family protein n=1 Tax=Alicyclobacillus sp. TaxID=61169 RepID=UPI0025C03B26|nr:DUF4446 family protein [Alicyclobacillus sp.]MCL6516010.1 DUF4446 family protein [Alicyclobacillus sp.]
MPGIATLPAWGALVAGALALIALILSCIALGTGARLNRRFRKWKTIHATADLEQVYERTVERVEALQAELDRLHAELERLQQRIDRKISTARIVRYNAFADTGSDLSFSIALLDDHDDGVVISSIYGREETRTYAKPVTNGTSSYPLTEEEQQVIMGVSQQTSRKTPLRV